MYGFLKRPRPASFRAGRALKEALTVRRESSTDNNNSLLNNDISLRHKNKHFFPLNSSLNPLVFGYRVQMNLLVQYRRSTVGPKEISLDVNRTSKALKATGSLAFSLSVWMRNEGAAGPAAQRGTLCSSLWKQHDVGLLAGTSEMYSCSLSLRCYMDDPGGWCL